MTRERLVPPEGRKKTDVNTTTIMTEQKEVIELKGKGKGQQHYDVRIEKQSSSAEWHRILTAGTERKNSTCPYGHMSGQIYILFDSRHIKQVFFRGFWL